MSVPYPAPPGFKWTRSILGLFGDWVLIEDDAFPLPPEGFRYVPHPLTAKPTLVATVSPEVHAVEGITSQGSRGNAERKPNYQLGAGLGHTIPKPIDPAKIGNGIDFFESTSRPVPGSDVYSVKKRDKGVFG